MKGLFIVFEGQDGAGKSTQIARLSDFLVARGRTVCVTREPGGTPVCEKIRDVLLDRQNAMTAQCEAYLYAASRAELVRRVIRPALEAGRDVLCDRFLMSSVAYQGYGRGLGAEAVRALNAPATDGLAPDLTFFFSLEPEAGMRRIAARASDRIEQEGADFRERVRRGYLAQADEDPQVVALDASRPPRAVGDDMIAVFTSRFAHLF